MQMAAARIVQPHLQVRPPSSGFIGCQCTKANHRMVCANEEWSFFPSTSLVTMQKHWRAASRIHTMALECVPDLMLWVKKFVPLPKFSKYGSFSSGIRLLKPHEEMPHVVVNEKLAPISQGNGTKIASVPNTRWFGQIAQRHWQLQVVSPCQHIDITFTICFRAFAQINKATTSSSCFFAKILYNTSGCSDSRAAGCGLRAGLSGGS